MDHERSTVRRWLGAIALALVALWPLTPGAAPGRRTYRIGLLETTAQENNATNFRALRDGLRVLGYVEGQNLAIVYRAANGHPERFDQLARELVGMNVDLIVTRGTPASLAAKAATTTIPIVMASTGDPLASGIVPSLAKPGGNITGLSADATEIEGKRLELLQQLVPRLARVAGLFNMGNPVAPPQWKEMEKAARSLSIDPQLLDARTPDDLVRAFDTAATRRVDAIAVGLDTLFQANRQTLVDLAARHRIPAFYQSREFVDLGGLISYAVSYPHMYRRAAMFVDRIFKGAKPADLPIEQPSKFELVINLKAARTLGLSIPQPLRLRADEVIQ